MRTVQCRNGIGLLVGQLHGTGGVPAAFHFPEHSLEPLVEAGWYPQFVDYLALSFNTATAFSPRRQAWTYMS